MKWRCLIVLLVVCMSFSVAALTEEDYIVAQPGDAGGDVRIVLEAAYNLGFLEKLSKDEEEYTGKYLSAVQQLEKALSLEADGIIHLSELDEIDGLIYPGAQGAIVQNILVKLANLGYIDDLPDNQSVYDQKYISSVINAEKNMDLIPDGYLTVVEQEKIQKQKLIIPDALKNLKVTTKNGKVELNWDASRNAVAYCIRRDGKTVATVKGLSWSDSDVKMGHNYNYLVIPIRYGTKGASQVGKIYIEPVYKHVDINELYKNLDIYIRDKAYIDVTSPRSKDFKYEWDGDNMYFLFPSTKDKYIYFFCPEYKYWTWDGSDFKPHTQKEIQFIVQGIVTGTKDYYGRKVPVVYVDKISCNYWE